jgi:hypothetical protein
MEFYSVIIHFSDLLTSWWSEFLIQLVVTLISVFGALGTYILVDRIRNKSKRKIKNKKLIEQQSFLIRNISAVEIGIQIQIERLNEFTKTCELLLGMKNKIYKNETIEVVTIRSIGLVVEFNTADLFSIPTLELENIFIKSKWGKVDQNTSRYLNFKNYLRHIENLRLSILNMQSSEIDISRNLEKEFDQSYSGLSLEFNRIIEKEENLTSEFLKKVAMIFLENKNEEYSRYFKMTKGDHALVLRNYLIIHPLIEIFKKEKDKNLTLSPLVFHLRQAGAKFSEFEHRMGKLLTTNKNEIKRLEDLKTSFKDTRAELTNLDWRPEYIDIL